jgi:deazaflavin-dependent oxidoreductase (nitroreductase family)
VALGLLQSRALSPRVSGASRHHVLRVTFAGAGIGWAVASVPTLLAGRVDHGFGVGTVVLLVVGLGLGAGSFRGARRSLSVRELMTHPWRWAASNAVGWPAAMALVFLGTSSLGTGRPVVVAAGACLVVCILGAGVFVVSSGAWMGTIGGQPVENKVSMAMLGAHGLGFERRLVGLAVTGRRTGLVRRFPVQYADHGAALVVIPVRAEHKSWWRNLTGADTSLAVLDGDGWRSATAQVLVPGDNGHSAAVFAYRRRWPRAELDAVQPVVVLARVAPGIPTVLQPLESVG